MGVRFTEDEAREMLGKAHTGVITTLRRDGWPVSLPMWFSVVDRKIYMRTLAASKKALRIKRDGRACFMVESGECPPQKLPAGLENGPNCGQFEGIERKQRTDGPPRSSQRSAAFRGVQDLVLTFG